MCWVNVPGRRFSKLLDHVFESLNISEFDELQKRKKGVVGPRPMVVLIYFTFPAYGENIIDASV